MLTLAPVESTLDPMAAGWAPVEAAVAGDPRARERFCQRYLPLVRRWLAYRWRRPPLQSQIADGVQEVFLECFRPGGALSRADADRGTQFEAYLRGVVRNVAARVERREARTAARYENYSVRMRYLTTPSGGQLESLDWARVRSEIQSAVQALETEPAAPGHTLGELVRLHFEDGLPVREIASRWQQAVDRVHELRRRACRILRRSLAKAIGISLESVPPTTPVVDLLAL